jgi:hypothetical protein
MCALHGDPTVCAGVAAKLAKAEDLSFEVPVVPADEVGSGASGGVCVEPPWARAKAPALECGTASGVDMHKKKAAALLQAASVTKLTPDQVARAATVAKQYGLVVPTPEEKAQLAEIVEDGVDFLLENVQTMGYRAHEALMFMDFFLGIYNAVAALPQMYLSIVALIIGLAEATANMQHLFPAHQMPTWLMIIINIQAFPLALVGLAIFSQLFGNIPYFSIACVFLSFALASRVALGLMTTGATSLDHHREARAKLFVHTTAYLLVAIIFLVWWFYQAMQEGANILLAKQVMKLMNMETLIDVAPQAVSALLMYVYKKQLSYVAFTDMLLHAMVQSENHEQELRRNGSHKTYYEDVARTCYRLDAIYNHRSWRRKQDPHSPMRAFALKDMAVSKQTSKEDMSYEGPLTTSTAPAPMQSGSQLSTACSPGASDASNGKATASQSAVESASSDPLRAAAELDKLFQFDDAENSVPRDVLILL